MKNPQTSLDYTRRVAQEVANEEQKTFYIFFNDTTQAYTYSESDYLDERYDYFTFIEAVDPNP